MPQNSNENKKPFLWWVAKQILEHHPQNMFSQVAVLPSRRACHALQNYFVELLSTSEHTTAHILPEFIPIHELWIRQSGFTVPDKDILLLELYRVYRKYWPEETDFSDFLPWGRMMLSDFDEIDKYLVPAQKLFTIIQDEKQIDAIFSIEQELREIMAHFWKSVNPEKDFEQKFILTWETLGKIYHEYTETLIKKTIAYEGLAYRNLYETTPKKMESETFQNTYHFVGFNAFTAVDEALIKQLSEHTQVSMYWDSDEYFMQKPSLQSAYLEHEAGNFLRQYKSDFRRCTHFWNEGKTLIGRKKYHLHGAPLYHGQVRVIRQLLKEISTEQETRPIKTGIILADEKMAEPLLYEIRDSNQVNITMSMPAGSSALTDWLEILYSVNSTDSIHKSDLQKLYSHYFFRILTEEETVRKFKSNLLDSSAFYFSRKILEQYIRPLLTAQAQSLQSLNNISSFWINCLKQLDEKTDDKHPKLKTIIPYFIQAIYDKEIILKDFENQVSFDAIHQLMLSHIRTVAVPFLSDSEQSVQIMGFLESRLIDFDRVIIAGANEDILPKSKRGNSYIPYSLRRPFGLPTLKEYDGVYAYHFFRLLKRCEQADFIYNDVPGDYPFEKSRFLRQIELELMHPSNEILNFNWSYPPKNYDSEEIKNQKSQLVIQKTAAHIEILKNMKFSQSALTLYLRCPVQFYLNYIAQIKDSRTVEEVMDAGYFGEVLHRAIELFYDKIKGGLITPDQIRSQQPELESFLKKAFEEKYQPYHQLKGQNLLAYDVIVQSLKKIIETDISIAADAPFRIRHTEGEFKREMSLTNGHTATLYGKIDRVDEVKNQYRILDYKTGKVELVSDKNFNANKIADLFKRNNTSSKPQTFQGLFYHYLYNKPSTSVGFYSIRDLSSGISFLNRGHNIPEDIAEIFSEELKNLLEEIMDPEIPFVQNPDRDAYKYSPYQFVV